MKYQGLFVLVCLIGLSTNLQEAVAQQEDHHDPEKMKSFKHDDPEIESMIEEFLKTSKAIEGRESGEQNVQFEGPKNQRNYYQVLVVTNSSNPLLDAACRKEAMEYAIKSIGRFEGHDEHEYEETKDAAKNHMKEHQEFIRENEISYSEYLQEISECKEFCAPFIAKLVKCHVLSVARREHGIALFALNSDDVTSEYENGSITEIAQKLRENSAFRVLLVGRASYIGGLLYNRELSGRRAFAVRDKLIEKGINAARINTMWFGWEPPQISQWIVDEYGYFFPQLFNEKGERQMNQSVELVLY